MKIPSETQWAVLLSTAYIGSILTQWNPTKTWFPFITQAEI